MRILVLSDLHCTATALDAVLDAARDHWDLSVCLGDVVGYGPDPNEVTARLREIGTQTIRGNHDKAVTGLMPTDDFNPVAKSAVDWTRAQLKPEHLAWLSALPHRPLAHDGASPVQVPFEEVDESVFTPEDGPGGLLNSAAAVSFFGQTHHPGGGGVQMTVECLFGSEDVFVFILKRTMDKHDAIGRKRSMRQSGQPREVLGLELGARPIDGGFCDWVKVVSGHQSGDRFVMISANGLRADLAQARRDFIGIGTVADDVSQTDGKIPMILGGIEDGVECSGVGVQITENENPHF